MRRLALALNIVELADRIRTDTRPVDVERAVRELARDFGVREEEVAAALRQEVAAEDP